MKQGLSAGRAILYDKKVSNGRLIDHKTELRTIALISRLRVAQKYNYSQIAQYLTKRSIPTKNRAKAWNHESVKAILAREGIH